MVLDAPYAQLAWFLSDCNYHWHLHVSLCLRRLGTEGKCSLGPRPDSSDHHDFRGCDGVHDSRYDAVVQWR